jgi:hypothetical protein
MLEYSKNACKLQGMKEPRAWEEEEASSFANEMQKREIILAPKIWKRKKEDCVFD